jgi:2-oxoglutarate ferredoxin oxidoreductase subunit beta
MDWLRENMLPYYPLGVYRDIVADGYENIHEAAAAKYADCPIAMQGKEA